MKCSAQIPDENLQSISGTLDAFWVMLDLDQTQGNQQRQKLCPLQT